MSSVNDDLTENTHPPMNAKDTRITQIHSTKEAYRLSYKQFIHFIKTLFLWQNLQIIATAISL